MNLYHIQHYTKVEGPGIRSALWTQGCSRHCKGCMLPKTWTFDPNLEVSVDDLLIQIIQTKGIEGITVLGGEPFEQPEELLALLKGVCQFGLSSIVFTGFTIEELRMKGSIYSEILQNIDVLVDGPYRFEQRSFSVPMAGSSNQRFIFLTDRYTMKDFPPNKVEIRIGKDGSLILNGMGRFEKIFASIQ